MRITEDDVHETVFICLTPKEAKNLTKDLMKHVGDSTKSNKIIYRLTTQLYDLFGENNG